MSKLFFDSLLDLKEVDKEIKKIAKTSEEREELWGLIDEIIHHKVMGCILDYLPKENHQEFLEMFHTHPNDEEYLFEYLRKKVGQNIEELIRQEVGSLGTDLLNEIRS